MSSPFAHRLHTNYVPSDEEIQQITQYLVDPTEKLARLDSDIARMRAALEELCSERNELSDHIDSHRALVSPVRRLPHDILREIFIACLPSDRNAVMSAQEAPVLLGQICSTWRNISLSTPRLWASIHIPIHSTSIDDERTQRRCHAVKTWLARSGTCPLSVSLYHSSTYPPYSLGIGIGPPNISHPIIEAVWAVSSRWKHICISMPPQLLSHLSTLRKDDVPWIESLQLSTVFYDWGDVFEWKHTLHIFEAPRFSSYTTNFVNRDLLIIPASWANLTELNLDCQESHNSGLTVDGALNLAHRCPNLITCRFFIFALDPFQSEQSARYTATLSQLRSLSITEGSGVSVAELFNYLVLPVLRNVVFRTYNVSAEHPVSLMALLSRATLIESLTFNWPTTTQVDFLECLHLLPHVVNLHVTMDKFGWAGAPFSTFDDACLQKFLPAPESDIPSHLCPRMESLSCSNVSFSDTMLLKFVNSRTGTVHPEIAHLKRIYVGFDHPSEDIDDFEAELLRLRSGGLEICMSYYSGPPSPYEYLSAWSGLPGMDLHDPHMQW